MKGGDRVGMLASALLEIHEDLGLNPGQVEACRRYLSEGGETEVLESLEYVDLFDLPEQARAAIRTLFDAHRDQPEVQGRVFNLFLTLGKQSVFGIISPFELRS